MRTTAAHREGWTQNCLRNYSTLTLCGVRPHIRAFWAPHRQPEREREFLHGLLPTASERRDPSSACLATAQCKTLVPPQASKPSMNLFKSPLSVQTYFLILLQHLCSLIICPALLQQLCQLELLALQGNSMELQKCTLYLHLWEGAWAWISVIYLEELYEVTLSLSTIPPPPPLALLFCFSLSVALSLSVHLLIKN